MTDRELLEMAAKAAGIQIAEWSEIEEGYRREDGGYFRPLSDSADALRLAISCRLNITFIVRHNALEHIFVEGNDADLGSDECAATRRAIVRAAAEIGRAME